MRLETEALDDVAEGRARGDLVRRVADGDLERRRGRRCGGLACLKDRSAQRKHRAAPRGRDYPPLGHGSSTASRRWSSPGEYPHSVR